MESGNLPPRLALIASMVPVGAHVADVGTDHGLLPAWLLGQGIAVSAIATDIRPGPLSRAEALRRERSLDAMRCILCDGLEGIESFEADTVIIAGMGGENIAGIIHRAPWACQGKLLLLQPMSRPEVLRHSLTDMGVAILEETLVRDSGRIYPVIRAQGGTPRRLSPAEEYTGQYELVYREELFLPMLDGLEKKTETAISGLQKKKNAAEEDRLAHLLVIREGLRAMRRRKNAERF